MEEAFCEHLPGPGPCRGGVLGAQAQVSLKKSHISRIAIQWWCAEGGELSSFPTDPQKLTEILCLPLEQTKFTFGK